MTAHYVTSAEAEALRRLFELELAAIRRRIAERIEARLDAGEADHRAVIRQECERGAEELTWRLMFPVSLPRLEQ